MGLGLATAPESHAAGPPVCERSAAAAPALARLQAALARGRFVAYQPTSLAVLDGRVTSADAQSIRADLQLLRRHFDSLITYDAIHGAQSIPPIAAALKYRAVIIGVWNPFDEAEVDAALEAAQKFPRLVAGVSLGNEMLFSHRADLPRLAAAVGSLRRRAPQLPLSTSEPFHIYETEAAAALLARLDFLLPNVHPVFQPWFRGATDATAAQFVVNVTAQLAQLFCGPILVKETGIPTAPQTSGFSTARQAAFYQELRERLPADRMRAFAYFAAFDAPWRTWDATGVPGAHPEEAHWGLYDAARVKKLAIDQLAPLGQDPRD